MNKSQSLLLKLASKFGKKYAQSLTQQSIQQALLNAASFGKNVHGIINFMDQLKRDQANMTIVVSKDGRNVSVSEPTLEPSSVAANYTGLSKQIKDYLEKYIELFPKDEDSVDLVLRYNGISPNEYAQK
jgi:hypothetical protein